MTAAVAVEVARAELRRAGTNPYATTGLARVMMGLSGIGVLAALSWLMVPGPGLPTSREVAVRTLWVSVSTAGVFWACGRWWARARLRNRARHIAMSPNLSPGLWAPDSWTDTGAMVGFLCFMALVFGIGSAHRASGKETAVGTVMMVIAVVFPMTIAIPADAAPQGETMKGAWFPWQRFRAHSRSWSLRATAVEGSPSYEAEFEIAIVVPDMIAAA